MSKGPMIYDTVLSIKVTKDQKEAIRSAATTIGSQLGIFIRTTLVKEAAKIKKAA
jgi:uncharacterized protein (DUF1778 family)